MQKIAILFLAVALLVVVAGCTQESTEAPPAAVLTTKAPSPTYLPTTTMATPIQTSSVNDNTITITRDGFSPDPLTVKRGATVRWVNVDSTDDPALYNPTHRIKIPGVYTSQTLSPGQGWSWVFTDSGTFGYQDLIHTDLSGTVVVEY